jgi:hypothetical protein
VPRGFAKDAARMKIRLFIYKKKYDKGKKSVPVTGREGS